MKLNLTIVLVLVLSSNHAFAFGKKAPEQPAKPIIQKDKELPDTAQLKDQLQSISISTSAALDVVIEQNEPDFSITISAAGMSESGVDSLLGETKDSLANGALSIVNQPMFYRCDVDRMNDVITSVSGTCLTQIRIGLPSSMSNIKIVANGTVKQGVESYEDLKSLVSQRNFDDDRTAAIQHYLSQPSASGRSLSMAQVTELLGGFNNDPGRISACQVISGRVSDPENASQIAQKMVFQNYKDEAVQLLSK